MAAEVLAEAGLAVTVLEAGRSPGRKFLLAGRGGLNLTHTEAPDAFLARYGPAGPRLAAALDAFGPDDLRAWAAGLGEPTVVGSSGRVFPRSWRATPLLRAWLARLDRAGVRLETGTRWHGWDDRTADVVVLALGGASWPRTGSDGGWVPVLRAAGVAVAPLRAANGGLRLAWSPGFSARFAGQPVKDVAVRVTTAGSAGSAGSAGAAGAVGRGDLMVTATGLEGGPVYAVSSAVRDGLDAGGAELVVDLLPGRRVEEIGERLGRRRTGDSTANTLRRLGLAPVAVGLVREATANRLPADTAALAALVKAVPLTVAGAMPIDRAISTAGGVHLDEVDEHFMLRRRPGTYVVGEMLDWEAPTGGYLLQATFATAVTAARGALRHLRS